MVDIIGEARFNKVKLCPVSLRVPFDNKIELDEICSSHSLSVNALINVLITRFLNDFETKKNKDK